MKKTMLLASVAALALCVGGVASAASNHHPVAVAKTTGNHAKFKTANRALSVLYDQNSDSEGYSDVSQNFESSLDAYDSQGADDFTVPKGDTWVVKEIDVSGLYFNGPGLANSENVFFYKATGKGPKTLVAEFNKVSGDDDGFGNFVINLGKKGAKLGHGHYYVSVQANMDFSPNGEWGWATRITQAGSVAMWQDPGDGLATGCTTWAQENICLENDGTVVAGPDHMFTLRGRSKGK
jgi:hypothetical protein